MFGIGEIKTDVKWLCRTFKKHEEKQDTWQGKINKKLEKCPKEDIIQEHDDDIKILKRGYWSTRMIWKVIMGIVALGTFALFIYRFLFT